MPAPTLDLGLLASTFATVFLAELGETAAACAGDVRVAVAVTAGAAAAAAADAAGAGAPAERVQVLSGRVTADMVLGVAPDVAGRVVMLCGPAPFMAAAEPLLSALGVPASRVLMEEFYF